ncbi:hypothetical protein HK104_004998 [Borealophlyctis nickersoniae]|nr:hypothetical protein HK104_004998 [Borealophlyctis nickersoniae]
MVAISVQPLPANPGLVVGYSNISPWAVEGAIRLVPGTDPDVTLSPSTSSHKSAYTASSVRVRLHASSGTQVGTSSSHPMLAALGSSGSKNAKWNGLEHLCTELELVPQTHEGANAVVVREGESVDLPFRFEFAGALPPTCEVERGRYNAYSRFRLLVTVEGRPHRAKHLLESRKISIEHDVPVPFYDTNHIQELTNPTPQQWNGATEGLDWEISLGSLLFSPGDFNTVRIRANLAGSRRQSLSTVDIVPNATVSDPRTAAAATLATNTRKNPAPFIRRAIFQLIEDATINTYGVASSPLVGKGKIDPASLLESERGGGSVRIVKVQIDGENLENGHEIRVQMPGLAPVMPTPGSKMDGKFKAVFDRKVSTGDTRGFAETAVQVNPSGAWGTFQVAHYARVLIEVADGHNVLWETPVMVSSISRSDATRLLSEQPNALSGTTTTETGYTTKAQELERHEVEEVEQEEQKEEVPLLGKGASVGSLGFPAIERNIPTARVGPEVAAAPAY